jgi:hypothetical protein
VESTDVHPEADHYIDKIKKLFPDVLFEEHLARDVDPTVRGPFGVARIELKDCAVPQKRKPFRMIVQKKKPSGY